MKSKQLFALSFMCFAALHAAAQNKPETPLWEIGGIALGVSQQAYPGSDQQVKKALALPYVIYRGKLFRADGNTAGVRAFKSDNFELDVGVAGSFGGGSNNITARAGMPDLGTRVEFGPRLRWKLSESAQLGRLEAELPVRGVFDLSDGLGYRGLAFEPQLTLSNRTASGWQYAGSISAVFGNQRLADSVYGVAAPFALPSRPAYAAQSGLITTRLGVAVTKKLSPDWRFFSFARMDSVAGAANENSPLVRQKNGFSVGAGVAYTWLRSSESAQP